MENKNINLKTHVNALYVKIENNLTRINDCVQLLYYLKQECDNSLFVEEENENTSLDTGRSRIYSLAYKTYNDLKNARNELDGIAEGLDKLTVQIAELKGA